MADNCCPCGKCTCCDCIEGLTITAIPGDCCTNGFTEYVPAIKYIGLGECRTYGRGSGIHGTSCSGLGGYGRIDWDIYCVGSRRYLSLQSAMISFPAAVEYTITARAVIQISNCASALSVTNVPASFCIDDGNNFNCPCSGFRFSCFPTFKSGCVES